MKIRIDDHGHADHKQVLLEVIRERIPAEEAPEGLKISLRMDATIGPAESYRVDAAADGFTVTGTPWGFRKLDKETAGDVTIRFKSPSDAFRVFTGQISVGQAYAQHKFVLRGDMALAMPFVRCVDITEGYLFPEFLAKRILKRLPEKEVSPARVYAAVVLGK